LIREFACEVGMSLRARDPLTGVLTFDLARKHQGHKYYRGASGAPIADSAGHIVALLLGGDSVSDVLWGVELARFRSPLRPES
jgi:hypothetical protein